MSLTALEPRLSAMPGGSRRARSGLRRIAAHPNWLAVLAYGALSLVSDWPIWPGDPSRMPTCECGDINQTLWFLRYTPYALEHGQNLFATHLMEYPQGVDLAQNTTIWLLGLLTSPLTLAVNAVASMNLLRWLAFVLSAYSMYFVLRRFTRFAPAAFVGGLLYGFSPYVVTESTLHLDLTFVPLPPLIFYGIYQLVVAQRAPAWRWGIGLGVLCSAQFFISAEVLTTTGVIAGLALVVLFLTCVRHVLSHLGHAIVGLLIGGAILAASVSYPLWMMRNGPDHYSGPAQGFNNPFNGDLLGAIVPTSYQQFAPRVLARVGDQFVSGNIHEDVGYLGVPLLVLACYLLVRYWRRLWLVYLALLAATAYVLSLGWELVVDRHVVALGFDMPFLKLEHFPFIANVEPVRFSLYTMFFVACIVALGLDAYADDVRARRLAAPASTASGRVRIGRLAGGALLLLTIVALVPNWPENSYPIAKNASLSAAALRAIPRGAVVFTYPFASPYTDEALYWQQASGMAFRLVGGYALISGPDRGSEYPHRLAPVQIESIFQESALKKVSAILPVITASQQTVTPATALLLRAFLARNHVDVVAVARGQRGSVEVSHLVELALGRPDAWSSGVLIWTGVRRALAQKPPRVRPRVVALTRVAK